MQKCLHINTTVYDSRAGRRYMSIRKRRHKCLDCGERFTTHEIKEADLTSYVKMIKDNLIKKVLELI